ncbi:hypothetical protein BDP27DRAFT_1363117 [Rhodocollybia butyracea]|uniref:F-box domain-containing protein n=1 Tax=Rhodocollybia butyracea TaxID=206335 RepID=A0A9P5PWF7_9AGAR|nr:hypothetical protein BDP27DRAFT_1363117 [Rhodocollybia butyracea]
MSESSSKGSQECLIVKVEKKDESIKVCPNCKQNIFARLNMDLSSIHEKLRSDSGPASVQPDEITSILQNARRDLDDYDREIHRLESRRMVLIAEKERTRDIMEHIQSLLVPIRKLPDEILGCIFDECCDMNYFRSIGVDPPVDPIGRLKNKPALVLISVCSRWRRIGLSLPQIWSRIWLAMTMERDGVSLWTIDQSYYEHPAETLTLFVERSKQHPLTIAINAVNNDIPPAELTFSFWSFRSEDLNILFTALSSLHDLTFPHLVDLGIMYGCHSKNWIFFTLSMVNETDMGPSLFAQSTNLIALDIPDIFEISDGLQVLPPHTTS